MVFGFRRHHSFKYINSSKLHKVLPGKAYSLVLNNENTKEPIVVAHNMNGLPNLVELIAAKNGELISIVECLDSFDREDIALYRPISPNTIVVKIPLSVVACHRPFVLKIS